MSNIEIACVIFSAVETALTIYFWRRYKKKLDVEIAKLTIATAEYETAVSNLNLWRNAT